MQFKKTRAILAAVLAAATAASALMITPVAAADDDSTYAKRFLSLYDDVVTNGQDNGYLSKKNVAEGGFGIPYHSVEELICEAPDYGHETTSEAMSYIVWVAAMHDKIAKDEGQSGSDLAKAWKTLEKMIPSATDQKGFWSKDELSAQVCKEYPLDVKSYPSTGGQENVGKNPIHTKFTKAYQSEGREYLLHWLADVDDWYGFGGSAEGTEGTFTFINTFQRGDQESCFETIPHPCIEDLKYGDGQLGMKFAFAKGTTAAQWSYTNAPDAEDRAIQAVYAANRWGVGDSSVSAKAGMMGDECRNNMFDKYYKAIGCQDYETGAKEGGSGLESQHFLMSWYTAWGGAANGDWAWQIGCSHSHQFYQNPLAAYGLLYDKDLSAGMKAEGAAKDYETSLQRQLEMYLWLQSADGPFAGGCTNCYNGDYSKYPDGMPTFYDMAYVEHPVYADPGSNHWTGNQFWATQRLAELYYVVCTDGDASGGKVKPGGLTIKEALKTLLDKWVEYFVTTTEFKDNDFSVVSSLDWSGKPAKWDGTYKEGANSGLTCSIAGRGNTDLGCANSLANTLIYYAKANGVEASGAVKEGTSLPEKALYTAQKLMDMSWHYGRDEIGLSRVDHNGSLARIFDQEVYIPSGVTGKYPYGYEVTNGAKFIDIRPMYKKLENYDALETAWKADVANGAKLVESTTGTNCDDYKNVAEVPLTYHRFWHAGDVMMALGTMAQLYPEVTPQPIDGKPEETTTAAETTTTAEETTKTSAAESSTASSATTGESDWGDVNCSGEKDVKKKVTVADAILLARVKAEDKKANITAEGKANADVNGNGKIDDDDLAILVQYLAGLVEYGAKATA